MKSLLSRLLYGGTTRLRVYESSCLDSLKAGMPSEVQQILEAQFERLDLVQRFSKDKMVILHFSKKPGGLPLFANRAPELYAATLTIRPASSRSEIRCDIVFHEGRISSLEFNRPPKPLSDGTFRVEKVEIHEDLLKPPAIAEARPSSTEILDRIKKRFSVSDVLPPAPETEVKRFLSRLSAAVPDDYVELLGETNGFSVEGWRFYGTKARRIVHEDNNYQLVAEKESDALCFRENESQPIVLFYDQIDDEVSEAGPQFVDALIAAVSKKDPK